MKNEVRDWPVPENEVPLRTKYVDVPRPKNNGKKRKNSNSGGIGRAARADKRTTAVSSRNSVEQWSQFKTWANKNGYKILG